MNSPADDDVAVIMFDHFTIDLIAARGVKEMVEMSKAPGEYRYPLTPLGSWQPSWL